MMSTASHSIQYLSQHRLESMRPAQGPHVTELRVVADDETGILPLVEAECQVVTRFGQEAAWPHRAVTLFVLADLAALQRQLAALGRTPVDAEQLALPKLAGLPAVAQTSDLLTRPVVNVYDLADPTTCHVFVNRQAMMAAGYWEDPLALQGLLAHEHAHPLAECATTHAVRQLQLNLALQLTQPWASNPQRAAVWAAQAQHQVRQLLHTLLVLGPREVFTNEIALAVGFGAALLYLNRQNVRNLVRGLAHRPQLQTLLAETVRSGQLSAGGAAALSLIGDLQGHLLLVLEIAAFQRQQQIAASAELLTHLQTAVFPALHPVVGELFQRLCAAYLHLSKTNQPTAMVKFVEAQMAMFALLLRPQALSLTYQVTVSSYSESSKRSL